MHATTNIEQEITAPGEAALLRPALHAPNVGDGERLASALAGGALVALGFARKSWGGLALAALGGSLLYRGATGYCYGYAALGVDTSEFDNPALGVRARHGFKYEKSLYIHRRPEELFQFWRRLENLPQVMRHIVSVTPLGNGRSHWVAQGPLGKTVEWDAEIHNEVENEMIAWRSIPGSEIDTAGSVHFDRAPSGDGTLLRVSLKYEPPGGKAVAGVADLLGVGLESRLAEDLRRFKQIQEAGEAPTTESQPRGSCRA